MLMGGGLLTRIQEAGAFLGALTFFGLADEDRFPCTHWGNIRVILGLYRGNGKGKGIYLLYYNRIIHFSGQPNPIWSSFHEGLLQNPQTLNL